MSDLVVKVRAITEAADDGRLITATYGQPVPQAIPSARRQALRELGAIGPSGERQPGDEPLAPVTPDRANLDATARGVDPAGGTEGVRGVGGTESGTGLPAGAPDARAADAGELAAYIDSADLNAAQTVSLAQGDPALAPKVIEAEQVSAGGDGRKTVIGPLEKLRDSAEPANGA